MPRKDLQSLLFGQILEEEVDLTLAELSRTCLISHEQIYAMVDVGIVDPVGRDPANWRFRGSSVGRVRCAQRLTRDLGVNTAGAALALELLEEIERFRHRLRRFER